MSNSETYVFLLLPATAFAKNLPTDQSAYSMSSPTNSSAISESYEYTDADAPYSALELAERFWDLVILP